MECRYCMESINSKAIKCPHCRSYQTVSGVLAPKFQAVVGLLLLFAVGTLVKGIADSYVQTQYKELDDTARMLALREAAKLSEYVGISYSDSDVTVFNYWKLKSRVNEIQAIMDDRKYKDVYACILSKGRRCEDLNHERGTDFLTVRFAEPLMPIEKEYFMDVAISREVISVVASDQQLLIEYAE